VPVGAGGRAYEAVAPDPGLWPQISADVRE
jgi:hypothetical protein